MVMKIQRKAFFTALLLAASFTAAAQNYPAGLIDKTIAVVGNEMISISALEEEFQYMRMNGGFSDGNMRCSLLENMLESKLFLMQARIDSLTVNHEMVGSAVAERIDRTRRALGDDGVEKYFGKSLAKLRQEWRQAMEDQSLVQQEQQTIAASVPDLTPYDVRQYLAQKDTADLPIVPIRYQISQICLYPDREAAKIAVKDKLIALRERIIAGEKFSTLARLYSEDPGSAMRGGELGMAPRSVYWPAFSDAAMSLRPGVISQVVETPNGFHIIEVLQKEGDSFNARHILMKPVYTQEDREKAFHTLDSLRTELANHAVSFELAAQFYSQDPATRTNGGQMADPNTGSSYFEIDQLRPQDYNAIKDLQVGEISEPFESRDLESEDGNLIYKIIRVDKIIPAHTATFEEDYSQILDDVQNEKAIEAIDNFINEKVRTTTIYVDPIFKGCTFRREVWNELMKKSE